MVVFEDSGLFQIKGEIMIVTLVLTAKRDEAIQDGVFEVHDLDFRDVDDLYILSDQHLSSSQDLEEITSNFFR